MKTAFENRAWIFAFLMVAFAYIFGLFIDLTGDSGLYAAISRQMVESGDWFNLKINGNPYDQKPHLFFWLAGLGIKLFGNTNFAFKLFPFIYGMAGVYFTFRLGKVLYSAETGKYAAIIAGTSQLFFLYFFDFHTDSVLQTGVVLALWQLATYLKTKKAINFILGFVGVGLAMLSKGPVGAVLPFFAVLLFLIVKKDFRQLFNPKWIPGILITLAIISPSLIHLYKSFGSDGLVFYFVTNNFGRITGEYAGSNNDYFFYLHTFLWAFLPWTIFVIATLVLEVKSWLKKETRNIWGIFLLGSVIAFTLILSIAKGKAPNYILIAISPVSIIAASWITRFNKLSVKTISRIILAQEVLMAILFMLMIISVFVFTADKFWIPILLMFACTAEILGLIYFQKDRLKRIVIISVIITGTLNLYYNSALIPDLYKYQGARQALSIYENNRGEKDVLVNLQLEEYELFYWANAPVEDFTSWENFYAFLKKEGSWVYTNQRGYEVVLELTPGVEKVYEISQRGMNDISISFLIPATREKALSKNYLIKVK